MKSFDSRTYSINDFREWEANGQLLLSPRFQRRDVWTDTARSYLMDTIVCGLPIPKIFLRLVIDPGTGRSMREVVDGQQRLKTILSYLRDGFVIRKGHNEEYGGLYFSQLPDDKRVALLNYELSADLLINMSDEKVLDIFSRLNSHAVVLNEQEKLNASHFGEFKRLADRLAHQHFEYWVTNRILLESAVLRMQDVSFTADLLVAMCDGIQSKKQIRAYYARYEKEFPFEVERKADEFNSTLAIMNQIFSDGFRTSEFRRIHLHYSLFTAIYHLAYGLPGEPRPAEQLTDLNLTQVRSHLEHVDSVFDAADIEELAPQDREFLNDSRRATTDASVRQRRARYLVRLAISGPA
jgi:hypothetical protein